MSSDDLFDACKTGDIARVRQAVADGVDVTNVVDKHRSDFTPLHYACQNGHTAVASFLLQEADCDPNCVSRDGQTPLSLTDKSELIRLLISSGAKPSTSCFPSHLRNTPTDMSIKMFVLGNPGAGKSTFIKALSTEGQGIAFRLKHQFTKVRDVDEKTAGIIPHDIHSKALGRLTLYDFAGHKEYYAGHDALLHNTLTNSPSIITLVVDMRDEEGKIRETLQYWFQFINNHTSEGEVKPHLLIIGSHADQIPSSEARQKSRVLESVLDSYRFECILFAGQVVTDCRYAESSSMSKLRSMLSQVCQSLRRSKEMAIVQYIFLVFLFQRFGDQLAITFNNAMEELRCKVNSGEYSYAYLGHINYFEICEKLDEREHILFMKNKEHPENSWIILDKAGILSHVYGVIFAPEEFNEYQRSLSTSTGVVLLSNLAPLFPNIDSDMITQFLCHLELCQEIKDVELVSLLATEGQSSPTAGERYFFFPGLVHLNTPQDVIKSSASKLDYNSGWILQCSKYEQFFSPRFLQVLLLRLAFLFALAPTDPSTTDHLALHRKCSVWKNGIYWVNQSGGEAIVEINHRQVVVIIRSRFEKMELVRLRSAIIRTVSNAKEDLCSKVLVRESLILPEVAAAVYPLDPNRVTCVSITEVAATIAEGKKFTIIEKDQRIELEKLIYFEPYAYLGEPLLQQLFSEDGTEAQAITDELLTNIATKCSPKSIDEYCAIFDQEVDVCVTHEGIHGLLHVFQLWRNKMGKEGTRMKFKRMLDQFSVFAGRNPLKLIIGGTSSAVASSSTNPTDHVDQHSSQYHESDSASVSSTDTERYKLLQQAMHQGHTVPLKFLKFVFLGPPGAGKSTFMRRLIVEIIRIDPDCVQPSTVTADQKQLVIKVCLDKELLSSRRVVINPPLLTESNSEWCAITKEEGCSLDDEALMIYRFINENQSYLSYVSETSHQPPTRNTSRLLLKGKLTDKSNSHDLPQEVDNSFNDQAEENESIQTNSSTYCFVPPA